MSLLTAAAILIASNMCLRGGEQVDMSPYISRAANAIELKVVVKSVTGGLVIYSPGYEEQAALFTSKISFGSIPIAEPILCIKAVGGPFEFDMEVQGLEEAYWTLAARPLLRRGVHRAAVYYPSALPRHRRRACSGCLATLFPSSSGGRMCDSGSLSGVRLSARTRRHPLPSRRLAQILLGLSPRQRR